MKGVTRVLGLLSIFFFLLPMGQAYELSSGSKKDANELVKIINLYYQASQEQDPKGYADLFLFASRESMAERIGTAIELWKMYDLKDYKVVVQEISISPSGITGLVRYQAKTTMANNRGDKKASDNEFMALFFKQDGVWLLGDINFADQFQAVMDQLHMVQTYADLAESLQKEPELSKSPSLEKKEPAQAKVTKLKKEKKQFNLSGMKRYEDKKHKISFKYPEEMSITKKGEKTKFISNSGALNITYEPMAYGKDGGKYKNSEEMIKYLSQQMQKRFDAKIKNISAVQVDNVRGKGLRFSWFMDGQKLEQVEVVFDGPDRMYSFGMIGTPGKFKSYAAGYESMLKSFRLAEKTNKFHMLTHEGAPEANGDGTKGSPNVGVASLGSSEATKVSGDVEIVNLSKGKMARQSTNGFGSSAKWAVDGNIDGNWGNNSVTHTDAEPGAWWEVDLGSVKTVRTVNVYNRTDCCGDRLNNFNVILSTKPIGSHAIEMAKLVEVAKQKNIVGFDDVQARYVRIQLKGINYLSLAEVEVFGPKGSDMMTANSSATKEEGESKHAAKPKMKNKEKKADIPAQKKATSARRSLSGVWNEDDPMAGRGGSSAQFRFDTDGSTLMNWDGSWNKSGTWSFEKGVLVIKGGSFSGRWIAESDTVYRKEEGFGPPERKWYVRLRKK